MNFRDLFSVFIKEQNAEGSNRASSYIRAIDLLDSILGRKAPKELNASSVWEISSAAHIQSLYQLVLEHQKLGQHGIFNGEEPSSYWKQNFCSAALRSYREFLVIYLYEQKMWEIYRDGRKNPGEIREKLAEQDIDSAELLVADLDLDLNTKAGKDAVREVKTRIGQRFFRKMILEQYNHECCITGLNVPEVLRASHIVGWAEDEKVRMNPDNGLCLSATYDAAFDKHLISFDEDYRMIFSPVLKEFYTNEAFKTQFSAFEGKPLRKPKRFCPDQGCLEQHREKLVA
ncbi:HNH endonuclease [Verrucomicrobia bacterium S94]|nr:HNH endonuclease [Verrucomicrobia bacterium S94]